MIDGATFDRILKRINNINEVGDKNKKNKLLLLLLIFGDTLQLPRC